MSEFSEGDEGLEGASQEPIILKLERPRPRKLHVTVPGNWYARPEGSPATRCRRAAVTPATISLAPGEAYHLGIDPHATDGQLAGLAYLGLVSALRSLELVGCGRITDRGLSHVRGLTGLETLALWGCGAITDAGLANLRPLCGLRSLWLVGCDGVSEAGLAHVGTLTNLRSLHLCVAGVGRTGLSHLRGLCRLRSLALVGCPRVTAEGLARLRGLCRLRSLDLSRCGHVEDEGVVLLKQALPRCRVRR